jgi:hypothetical protein
MAGRLRPIDLGTAVLLSGKSTFCPTILKCEGAYPSSPTRQRIPGFDLDVARFKKSGAIEPTSTNSQFFRFRLWV